VRAQCIAERAHLQGLVVNDEQASAVRRSRRGG
jgi:hypothetical protein